MQAIDTSLANFPYERLILELLDQQDTFERLLAIDHIDDKLVNKQISMFDEEDLILRPEAWQPDDLNRLATKEEPRLRTLLHDMAFVNRQRRYWRLFKDWNPAHRPW